MSGALDEDALLQRLSGDMARLHSWDEVTAYIITAAVQLLGGNTGSLCLLTSDRRELEIVAQHGYSLEVTAVWTRFRLDAPLPASEAARTGRAVFITSPHDRDRRYPIFREQPVVEDEAYAIEPLLVDGHRESTACRTRRCWPLPRHAARRLSTLAAGPEPQFVPALRSSAKESSMHVRKSSGSSMAAVSMLMPTSKRFL